MCFADKSPIRMAFKSQVDRLALVACLGLIALNLLTTGRWAAVPGAPRGWRWPYIVVAIVLTSVATIRPAPAVRRWPPWASRVLLWGGLSMLAGSFLLLWFPPSSWPLIPFVDDWPPRFSSTVEGLSLLRRGTFVGWQWNVLGGYPTATDVTQSLTLLGALPMALFGNAVGFHLLHLLLFLALPVLVFIDLKLSEPRHVAAAAAGLVALTASSEWGGIIKSGDSNSLAGLVAVMAVVVAGHRARTGARYALTLLVLAFTLVVYSHLGFFLYAVLALVLESVYYRDWRQARRALVAAGLAVAVSLPLTFELFRYPSYFNFNNVLYAPPAHIDWIGICRKVGYNVQVLLSPHRWFADTTKLFGPIILLAAWWQDGRAGFYAWAAAFFVCLTCLGVPEVGYSLSRATHLLVVFTPVVIAWFVTTRSSGGWQAAGVLALAALSLPIVELRVPHEASVDAFAPSLVDRLRTLDSRMVLVENNPHRNVAAPGGTSEKSLFGTHYEALLPSATGKRLYAGYWDGWQWTPFRGEMLAGGAWQGHLLTDADHAAFLAELRRWGIRYLLVWSQTAKAALAMWPELVPRWEDGPWRQFELVSAPADTRDVITDHGRGELVSADQLGGLVRLVDVERGDRVIVRTHYHPAWAAFASMHPIATLPIDGQLSFTAPASGSYDVSLVYPARRWLLALSGAVLGLVIGVERLVPSRRLM